MTIGAEKSKKTIVPKRPRGERSPTAFKAATKTGGLSYPHKGKMSNEAEVLKTKDRKGTAPSTHGQRREAWKTAESCGVTESGYLKYRYGRLSLVRVSGYCWDRPTVL